MILGNGNKKPEITYPCEWTFKVIGDDVESMILAMEEAVRDFNYEITPSNISKKGKYFSMNLIVSIISDEERYLIYDLLSKSDSIKYIL